ncbi:hypothetical protein BBL07_15845 [Agrobacterium vitis]|nr:hypothetical protein BBL07_15845 [Agrobacterium vitis]
MNLLDVGYWDLLRDAYRAVPNSLSQVGPGHLYNPSSYDLSKVGYNYRDCAAVNALVQNLENSGQPVDSIIAAFAEGNPVAADSWLFDQSTVMVNVRNPKRIKILGHTLF